MEGLDISSLAGTNVWEMIFPTDVTAPLCILSTPACSYVGGRVVTDQDRLGDQDGRGEKSIPFGTCMHPTGSSSIAHAPIGARQNTGGV